MILDFDNDKPYYILSWINSWYTDSFAPGIEWENQYKAFTSESLAREFYNKKKDDKSCKNFELYYLQSQKIDL